MVNKIKKLFGNKKKSIVSLIGISGILGISIIVIIFVISAIFLLRESKYVDVLMRVSQSDGLDIWGRAPAWYVSNLKEGLTEKDFFGKDILTIRKIYEYPTNDNNKLVYINIRMLSTYNKRTGQYTYAGIPLLVGSYQKINLQGIYIPGVIYAVDEDNLFKTQNKMIIQGFLDPRNHDSYLVNKNYIQNNDMQFSGVPSYVSKVLKPGLQMSIDGHIIAEIQNINRTPVNSSSFPNNIYPNNDDIQRENIQLIVQINTETIDNKEYFNGQIPVIINALVPLEFENITVFMTVTDIKKL